LILKEWDLIIYVMTELIENKNSSFNDEFEDIDLEIDNDLQNFMDFVKNKENNKIPEPTNYVISTQSGWCCFENIDNINLSNIVMIISKNIMTNHIFNKNDEYLIQGLVIENLILRFDDIYMKKYKKNYIKFFDNVINPTHYEDCLLMFNNLHLLETSSLKKQGRQKNKKDNESFYNSCTIILKGEKERKCVNVKLFNNGQITFTGAKKDIDGYSACTYLLNELKKHDNIFIDTNKEIIEKSNISNFKITMINSDFNCNFKIDLLKFMDILNNLEKDRFIKFNPAVYRGLMIGYFWNENKKIQDGCCSCQVKCSGKKKKSKTDKNIYCKKITISIFKSGSVIITGGYLKEQIDDAYRFINNLFSEHYHDIIKLSILDFIDEN
jgi:hypothetical protein